MYKMIERKELKIGLDLVSISFGAKQLPYPRFFRISYRIQSKYRLAR